LELAQWGGEFCSLVSVWFAATRRIWSGSSFGSGCTVILGAVQSPSLDMEAGLNGRGHRNYILCSVSYVMNYILYNVFTVRGTSLSGKAILDDRLIESCTVQWRSQRSRPLVNIFSFLI